MANTQDAFCAGLSVSDRAGSKLPIVFLHGSGFCKEVFRKQFASKSLAQHRLISIDLPGHGASPNAKLPRDTYSFAGFADAVQRVLLALDIKECLLAGWSLGGQIALEFLSGHGPVKGVAAFGATPCYSGPLGIILGFHTTRGLNFANRPQHLGNDARAFEDICFNNSAQGAFVHAIERVDPIMRKHVSRSIMLRRCQSQRVTFEQARIPVALIQGAKEPFIRTSYMKNLRSPLLYQGEPWIVEGVGHAPFFEVPDAFDAYLAQFANTVASAEPMGVLPRLKRA